MIKYNFTPISMLLLAEALERFAYFFVSFIFVIYMMTPLSSGGLGFTQEQSFKTGGIFSICILILPVLVAPLVDRKIGLKYATFYGGLILCLGYLFAFLSFFLFSNLIFLSFAFCALGSSLVKPTMNALVSKTNEKSSSFLDFFYIIFIVIVNISSITSAYAASLFVMKFSSSFYYFFLVSAILLVFYMVVIHFFHKIISSNKEMEASIDNKNFRFIYYMSFPICFLVGISTTLSAKIFSPSSSSLFWIVTFLGIFLFSFFFYKIRKINNKFYYKYFFAAFLILFFTINLFIKQLGSFSPLLPSLFSSFDMLLNFVVFPLALSFIARFSNARFLVTTQALSLFCFALSSLFIKNILAKYLINSDMKIIFLILLVLSATSISLSLCLNFERTKKLLS